MTKVKLGKFCKAYAQQNGGDATRIYASLYAAILGGKVSGIVEHRGCYVNPHSATVWLEGRGRRAATPKPKPYTPNFHCDPSDPFYALFI